MKNKIWLTPGLKIKRWFLIFLLGSVLMIKGIQVVNILPASEMQWQYCLNFHLGWFLSGFFLVCSSIFLLVRILLLNLVDQEDLHLLKLIKSNFRSKKSLRIVAVGGGTGISNLLLALKEMLCRVTAVITVTDDGGSSGRLKTEMKIPPPGDIRNCMAALAENSVEMKSILEYTFDEKTSMAGHKLGNVLIAGMTELNQSLGKTAQQLNRFLKLQGAVLPVSDSLIHLQARMVDGTVISGETAIVSSSLAIEQVFFEQDEVKAFAPALQALREADVIVIGPGSLYTSIIPNLLVPGVVAAINDSRAKVYYICNIMTQPGETDGYTAADHLKAIKKHAPDLQIDKIVLHENILSAKALLQYRQKGASPVVQDQEKLKDLPVDVVVADIAVAENYVRHDPRKLSRILQQDLYKKN